MTIASVKLRELGFETPCHEIPPARSPNSISR
jgi:hypothetical protein